MEYYLNRDAFFLCVKASIYHKLKRSQYHYPLKRIYEVGIYYILKPLNYNFTKRNQQLFVLNSLQTK
jgi:hypothetical protein